MPDFRDVDESFAARGWNRRAPAAEAGEVAELRRDAGLLAYLQADLDKAPHETVFSVYEYGTRVFALRNALEKRQAIDAQLAKDILPPPPQVKA